MKMIKDTVHKCLGVLIAPIVVGVGAGLVMSLIGGVIINSFINSVKRKTWH